MQLFLLQLIIFLLPNNTALHFWPNWSRIVGIKIDYYSPALYFTDLLILSLVLFSIPYLVKILRRHVLVFIAILVFILINISISSVWQVSLYSWVRLCLHLIFFLLMFVINPSKKQLLYPLLLSLFYLIPLTVFQFVSQSSVGGIFRYLGETQYHHYSPNIAKIFFNNFVIIRPYGTFPHPNVLSGYLFTLSLILYGYQAKQSSVFISIFGFLTLSRAYLVSICISFFLSVWPHIRKLKIVIFAIIIAVFGFTVRGQINQTSFTYRVTLLQQATINIYERPVWGTGLGTYIQELSVKMPASQLTSHNLQPVHNVPALLMSELGLFMVGSVIYFVACHLKSRSVFLLPLLPLLFLDHYFFTIGSTRLMFLIYVYLLLQKKLFQKI